MILKLDNGARAVRFVWSGTEGIVQAFYRNEWVVWYFFLDGPKVICEHGDYFKEGQLAQAEKRFMERACRLMTWPDPVGFPPMPCRNTISFEENYDAQKATASRAGRD